MILFESEPWPVLFELDPGESTTVLGSDVRVTGVEHVTQPDHWSVDNPDRRIIVEARVSVEVDGRPGVLLGRPYQMPQTLGGLRLCVETTRPWSGGIRAVDFADKAVRLSARRAGEPWGPAMMFPLRDYRWRSNTYQNTWAALVPFNRFYHHRGEDFGAIPDRLEIVSMLPGVVAATPLPDGDGKSNTVRIAGPDGMTLAYAHMNLEHIDASMRLGAEVSRGQSIGRTGMTWAGEKRQFHDPHLHLGLLATLPQGQTPVNSHPHVVEAYLRTYDDPVLAVAGGYQFAEAGGTIELDGSRSVVREGESARMSWLLHDGRRVDGPRASVTYDRPGFYSETLVVRDAAGHEDRDFARVRVFDPRRGRDIARGWAYHWPIRPIRPGDEVLFWNRLSNLTQPVAIDFGDGAPAAEITDQTTHRYDRPGLYTVALRSRGPSGEPVELAMRLVVEP